MPRTLAIPAPEALCFMNGLCRVRLASASNTEELSLLEFDMPEGFGPPLHVHHDQDETFQVLEGRLRVRVGDAVGELGEGEAACLPQGVPHTFRVISAGGARTSVITRGGQFERMVRSMSEPARTLTRPPPEPVTPEMAERLRLACERERMTLLGPPID